ncbi:MAG: hypothetical protein EOP51_34290, partial [Sphingobacteriales bacterium]
MYEFKRVNGVWSQIGTKIAPADASSFGSSIAMSADGKSAVVSSTNGKAWFYTKNSGSWVQLGTTLNIGSASGQPGIAMSADGLRAAIGQNYAQTNGLASIYRFNGTIWELEATVKGNDFEGTPRMGSSLSLNGDGSILILGGPEDNTNVGAVWAFKRTGTTWTQSRYKIVAPGAGTAKQGKSVAISADGTSTLIGGPEDGSKGAAWQFEYQPKPFITGLSASAIRTGSIITITGEDFTGTTAVTFGGTLAASFVVDASTSITATVAAGTSGAVTVTNAAGSDTYGNLLYITASVFTSTPPASASALALLTYKITTTSPVAVSYAATILPSWLTFSNISNQASTLAGNGTTNNS